MVSVETLRLWQKIGVPLDALQLAELQEDDAMREDCRRWDEERERFLKNSRKCAHSSTIPSTS